MLPVQKCTFYADGSDQRKAHLPMRLWADVPVDTQKAPKLFARFDVARIFPEIPGVWYDLADIIRSAPKMCPKRESGFEGSPPSRLFRSEISVQCAALVDTSLPKRLHEKSRPHSMHAYVMTPSLHWDLVSRGNMHLVPRIWSPSHCLPSKRTKLWETAATDLIFNRWAELRLHFALAVQANAHPKEGLGVQFEASFGETGVWNWLGLPLR